MPLTAKAVDRKDVLPGVPVYLDGRQSEAAVRFKWEIEEPQRGARLVGRQAETVQFLAAAPGDYRVRLNVSDGTNEETTVALVTVLAFPLDLRHPHEAVVGQPMTFTASCANEPAEADYRWSFEDPSPDRDPFVTVKDNTATVLPWKPGVHTAKVVMQVPDPNDPSDWLALSSAEVTIVVQSVSGDEDGGPDDAWWQEKANTDTRGALASVVAAATTWQGYTATLLGLFGTVTIVAGPEALSDLPQDVQRLLVVISAIAFALALLGIYLLSKVTAKAPVLRRGMTGDRVQGNELHKCRTCGYWYRWSKRVTITAAALIAAGSLLAAGSGAWAKTSDIVYVLVRDTSETYCGPLTSDSDGQVQVAGVDLADTESVTVVDSCGGDETPAAGK